MASSRFVQYMIRALSTAFALAIAVPAAASAAPPTMTGEEFGAGMAERLTARKGPRARAGRTASLSAGNWDAAVDSTWGPGLPTARKLEIFDAFWRQVDERLATWQGIEDVDWNALRERYRPEVAAGVSRGRFAAIMNYLSLALRESHTQAMDVAVNFNTAPAPGVPLIDVGPWGRTNFGSCGTALPDGSVVLHDVAPGHPLGVEPGDRVLGYDGRPWRELYQELLDAELPMFPFFWGSTPTTFEHTFVASAHRNWHLFETIDIQKHDTGEVQHLSTTPLQQAPRSAFCTEQLDVGIPKPQLAETNFGDLVSWGMLPGTRIGYIYAWGWFGTSSAEFTQAVYELTQQQQTDGLILDYRFNLGGSMFAGDGGLDMLFDHPLPTIGWGVRARPDDHFKMRRDSNSVPGFYTVETPYNGIDPRSYDRPIAILTGPGALSAGDQIALRTALHPRARTFGKSTAGAFNAPVRPSLDPDWYTAYAAADAARLESPQDYLTHDEFPVDEPTWLTADDAAAGRDTVVEAARSWIDGQG